MVKTGERPLEAGLVLDLRMSEGVGTVVHDVSGERNHGVFGAGAAAPSWVDGETGFGKALEFDGNDYANVNDDPTLKFGSGDFSVSIMFRPSADITTRQHLFSKKWDIYNTQPGWMLCIINGNLEGRLADNPNINVRFAAIIAEVWQQGAVVRSGNFYYLYLNGVLESSQETTMGDIDNARDVYLGRAVSTNYPYTGRLDEARNWNRALSAEDVALLFAQRGRV